MLGRSAYQDPLLIGRLDDLLYGEAGCGDHNHAPDPSNATARVLQAADIAREYIDYMWNERERGTPVKAMARHLTGLFARQPGARHWRRSLSEIGPGSRGIDQLLSVLTSMQTGSRYNAGLTGNSPPIEPIGTPS
jgi:tRNA-dihydrouridine synthase A